jgi:limonene-1,2-epoxide hydrolase
MSNLAVVREFIDAWNRRDLEAVVAAFTEDAVYINVGFSESVGREAIRAGLEPFLSAMAEVRWTVHHEAETASGVVLNERTDEFAFRPKAGGRTLTAQVMGVFEIRDGKIAAWRDYFDTAGFRAQMGG